MLKHFLRFAVVAAMFMVGCSEDPTNENENNGGSSSGNGPAQGQITLQLGAKGFTEEARVTLDGVNLTSVYPMPKFAWEE